MVSMLVRKSGPTIESGASMSSGGMTMPGAGSTVNAMLAKAGLKMPRDDAAEVGEGGQALDGVELDDETVRAQQVVDQVSTLVKENPDAAASLVKRWMSRG